MNSRILAYLTCFVVFLMGVVSANDSFDVKCKKKCSSCDSSSSCSPDSDTYEVVATFEAEDKAQEEADRLNGDTEGKWKDCKVEASNTTSNGGTNASTDTSPGLTSLNFKRQGLVFDGVSPDYVKFETVNETINGVITIVKKPVQLPTLHSTVFYSDLPDGSGYQASQYLNSQISAPDANGFRTIPAGVQPVSITIYRQYINLPNNPALSTLDVIHKQRHPQSGAWVTRLIRKFCPQGNNQWVTQFYLGDPAESIGFQPYREISITRTPNPTNVTEESTREVTKDRDSSGALVITSDASITYGFYKYGDPVKLSETRHTGTGSELTTTWTYFKAPADQASFNKPATMRRSDGQWANYTYQGSPVTGILLTKTVSGWLNNAAPAINTAPNEAANRVVIEIEAKNETGTFSREEKVQGVLVSKTWGERYKDNSGMLIEKSRVETGTATLLTLRTGWPNNSSVSEADRGRLKSIQHPDSTVELHNHTQQGDNLVTTTDKGAGSLSAVTDGTRTVSTFTKGDTLIKEVVSDIASGVVLSAREAIAFDADDQPSRWAYDNDIDDFSETLKGCCGIDSTRSRDGIVTTYTRDGLKRPKTAVSQGITLTYTYGRKSIGGTDFPTENVTATAGGLTLDKGTTVRDHAGNVIQQITPDLNGDGNPEITTITRDFATRTTTATNPDGGTTISTDFADGQSKSTTGTATAPRFYGYSTHAEQGGGERTSTAPTATGPWTRTYQNLAGRTLKSTFDDGSTELALQTNTCDGLGRLVSSKDADNVTQLVAYNAKGEAYRRAIDLNQNGQIDNDDRVTDTLQDVVASSPIGNVLRSRSIIYDTANNPVTVSTSYRSPDGLTTRQETLGVANPATSTSASSLDRADGSWTDTITKPDGTKQTTTYSNWLAVSTSSLNTENSPLETSTTSHDALRRPITQTHSRTGLVTTHYAANGQVSSIDDHGRITSFAYDSMGRRTATTLPDNSITHTSYWLTGQEKATWGSQTNPTVKLYSPQGQLVELRTFRSANLALAPDETTPNSDATTWIYETRNQLTRKQYADGKGTGYTYTPGGRLHTRTWARGVVTTYGYSTAGELTTTDYSDGTPDVTIAIDKIGRQQSVTNGVAISTSTYDPATLRLDQETIAYDLNRDGTPEMTRVLDRSQDTLGRDTGFQLKDGTAIENRALYGYSAAGGRLATVTGGGDVPSPQTFTYGYTPNSSLLQTVTGPVHTTSNTWEPTRNVLASKQNKVGTDVISQYDYTVNGIGQRTGVNTSGTAFPALPTWLWGYDSLGQVISADSSVNTSDRAYEYDAIGNRKKSAASLTLPGSDNYTSNALNQYSAVDSVSPSYDDDGNATAYPLPVAPTTNSSLVWDAENRKISDTVGTNTNAYQYDAQSRRIAKTSGTVTTLYLYDGFNCIAEYEVSTGVAPALKKTRLWGTDLSGSMQGAGGVGGLLCESRILNSQISNYFPTYDGNGNVSEYLGSTGSITAHFEYDPFGNTVVNTDGSVQFCYRFSTKPLDFATGLYYYQYRYYDPQNGRWPSRDPLEEVGGNNLYGMTCNDPIYACDTLGMFTSSAPYPALGEAKRFNFSIPNFDAPDSMAKPLAPFVWWDANFGFSGVSAEAISQCVECPDGSSGEWKEANITAAITLEGGITIGLPPVKKFGVEFFLGLRASISVASNDGIQVYRDPCKNDSLGGGLESQMSIRGGIGGGAYVVYKKHFFGAQAFGEYWGSVALYGTIDSGGILSVRTVLSSGGMYGARASIGFGIEAEYSKSFNSSGKTFGPWEIADFSGSL